MEVKYSKAQIQETVVNYLKFQFSLDEETVENAAQDVTEKVEELPQDKKIAVYYTGKDCPFVEDMLKVIEGAQEQEKISSKYEFYPEADSRSKVFLDGQMAMVYVEFKNACGDFCKVKPANKEILKIEDLVLKKL